MHEPHAAATLAGRKQTRRILLVADAAHRPPRALLLHLLLLLKTLRGCGGGACSASIRKGLVQFIAIARASKQATAHEAASQPACENVLRERRWSTLQPYPPKGFVARVADDAVVVWVPRQMKGDG